MYDTHVPIIAAAMRDNPVCFERGIRFALLSIKQMIVTVPTAVADTDTQGLDSHFLFGSKRDAWLYLEDHADSLWRSCAMHPDPAMVIQEISRIPGIGIVKAGFIAQMLGHDVACLDTRNIQRESRNPREYRSDRKSSRAYVAKIARYVADVRGKARFYWDTWCNDVATRYGMTGEAISKLHLDCIVPVTYRSVTPLCVPFCEDELPF